ncbi:MAG TPA: FtsX-like permease family protein [bacterium]|nr:FtsX-like permease family protein [bacterium]
MRAAFILKAVMHNMKHRCSAVVISTISIACAFAFLSAIGNVTFGLATTAVNSSLSFPLVIGPEGSSDTQLVMSTVFNIDKPKGTLEYSVFEELIKDKRVASAFPVARADSYMGIPITGVNSDFIKEKSNGFIKLKEGFVSDNIFPESDLHRAVIGFKIAERYGLTIDDKFVGSHGHVGDENAHRHDDFQYYVAGVMNPINGPEDFSIYINFKAVWKIHEHHGEHSEHRHEAEHEAEHEHHEGCDHGAEGKSHETLSAILVKTVNPVATSELEREYSSRSGTSATDVAKTVRRVVQYMNKAETAAGFFSYGTLLIVLAMVFVTMVMAINERKKEMAMMRTLGIGKLPISLTVMIESMIITVAGVLAGVVLGHFILWYLKPLIDFNLGISLEPFFVTKVEIQGILVTLVSGQILSLVAMLRIYNMNLVEEVARD